MIVRYIVGVLLTLAAFPGQAETLVKYVHTDALGSVVAITDANRNVIERREYEPYGAQLTPIVQDGPGYTGHVQDAATGLVYMQQRYYDPIIGRFLSIDPATAYSDPLRLFNRYWYASNNPYSKIDPDGRRDIYIGGGADKDDTRIVQNYADAQKASNPGRDIQYFAWNDDVGISAAISAPLAENEPLNVIGHSLGAGQAINHANGSSAAITNLVTIDPVGLGGGDGSKPAGIGTWTNVTADPASSNRSDGVAAVGRAVLGTTLTSGADVSVTSSANHGAFSQMMSEAAIPALVDSSYDEMR